MRMSTGSYLHSNRDHLPFCPTNHARAKVPTAIANNVLMNHLRVKR
jgi:hypothetical protein